MPSSRRLAKERSKAKQKAASASGQRKIHSFFCASGSGNSENADAGSSDGNVSSCDENEQHDGDLDFAQRMEIIESDESYSIHIKNSYSDRSSEKYISVSQNEWPDVLYSRFYVYEICFIQ